MSSPHPHDFSQTLLKEEIIIHPEEEEDELSERSIPEDVSYEASVEEDHTVSADVSIEEATPTQPKDVEAERKFTGDEVPVQEEEYVLISDKQIPEKPLGEEFTIITKEEIPSLDLPRTASDEDKDVKPYSGESTSSFEDEKQTPVDVRFKPKTDEDVSISSEEIPEDEFEEDVSISSATSEEEIEEKGFEVLMPDIVPKPKEKQEKDLPSDKIKAKSPEKVKIEDVQIPEDIETAKQEFDLVPERVQKDKHIDEDTEEQLIIPKEDIPKFLEKEIAEQIDIPHKPTPEEMKYVGKVDDEGVTAPEKPKEKEKPVEIVAVEISKEKKPDIIEEHVEYKPDRDDLKDQITVSEKPEREAYVVPEKQMPPEASFEALIRDTDLEEEAGKDIDEDAFLKEKVPAMPIKDREDVIFEFKMPKESVPGDEVAAEYELGEAEEQPGYDIHRDAIIPEDLSPEDLDEEMIIHEDREQPENIGFITHTYDYLETVPEEDSYTSSQDASFSVDDQPEGPTGEDTAAEKTFLKALIPDKDLEVSETFTVGEETIPQFLRDLSDQEVTEGDTVTFIVELTGTPLPEVSWYKDGKLIESDDHYMTEVRGNFASLIVKDVVPDDDAEYIVKANNDAGTTSSVGQLFVNPIGEAPTFVSRIDDKEIEVGGPITLECQIRGHPKPRVTWFKDGEEIIGDRYIYDTTDETARLTILETIPEDEGEYTVKAINDKGVATSSAEVLVQLESPKFTETLKDVSAQYLDTAILECTIVGKPTPKVTWLADESIIEESAKYHIRQEADHAVLEIHDVSLEDSEVVYSCRAENPAGEIICSANLTTQEIASEIIEKPEKLPSTEEVIKGEGTAVITTEGKAPEFLLKIQTETVEEGETADFNVEVIGTPKPEIHWLCNGIEITPDKRHAIFDEDSLTHLQVYDIDEAVRGTYTVEAINEYGTATCSAELVVQAKPEELVEELVAPKFIVEIQTVEATIGETAKFTCKATGKPKPEILWFKNDKEISKTDNRFSIQYGEEGEETLLIVDVLPEHDGTYTVEAKNPTGSTKCKAELFVEDVKEDKPSAPEFIKVPEKVSARQHDTAQFMVKVIGTPKPKVVWKKDNMVLEDKELYHFDKYEDTYCFEVKDSDVVDAGVYTCVATNEVGEVTVDIPLIVNEIGHDKRLSESPLVLRHQDSSQPPEFIEIFESCTVMEDKPLQLTCKVTGLPRPEVTWLKDNKEIAQSPNIKMSYDDEKCTLLIKKINMDHEGEYKVVAKNSAGTADITAPVTVEGKTEKPEFTRKLNNRDVKEGRPVKFECSAKGIPAPEITWYLNDKPVEGVRFHTDVRKSFSDIIHSLSIDKTEVVDAGEVKAVAKNKAGEAVTIAKLLVEEKKESPKFVRKLDTVNVVENDSAILEVEVTGKPKPHVIWLTMDKEIPDTDRTKIEVEGNIYRLTITGTKKSDEGLYTARASNPAGQVSCNGRVKIQPARRPSIMTKLEDTLIPENAPAKFECQVEGLPLPDVKWFLNDKELEEGEDIHIRFDRRRSTYTLEIDNATAEMQGLLKAVAANAAGEQLMTANLEVRGQQPIFEEVPIKCTILEGDSGLFRCLVSGEPTPDIQWSKGKWNKIKDGGRYKVYKDDNTGENVLEIANIKKKDAGTYLVTAKNEHGSAEAPATLIVTDKPEDVQDWKDMLKHREIERKQIAEEELVLPSLKHVEQEEQPQDKKEKFVPGFMEQDEPVAFEIFKKRRESQLAQLPERPEPEKPSKREKPELETYEKPKREEKSPEKEAEEEKGKYIRGVKPKELEEVEEYQLKIPKAKWEFVVPLKDITVKETEEAIFECELNIPNISVTWTVNGQVIEQTPKYIIKSDKTKHTLVISKCRPEDKGEITCSYAKLQTVASLTVEEVPAEFTLKLEDARVEPNQDATFTCKANKDVEVNWLIDSKEIPDSPKYDVKHEDVTHSLTIKDLDVGDSCEVSAVFGDTSTSAKLLVEDVGADFTLPLKDVTGLENSDVQFTCELTKPSDDVKWFLNDKEVQPSDKVKIVKDGKTHKLVMSNVNVEDEGQISVAVGDKKSTAGLYVDEVAPKFTKPLSDATIMEGDTAELTCEVNKEGATVKWFADSREITDDEKFEIISDATVHKLRVKDATLADTGEITAKVEDQKTTAKLSIEDTPVEFLAKLTEQFVEENQECIFTCVVDREDVTVDWFHNDTPLLPSDKHILKDEKKTHTLVIKNTDHSDIGQYTVVVGDSRSSAKLNLDDTPIEIVTPLKQTEGFEQQNAIMSCRLSRRTAQAQWLKGNDILEESEKYHMTGDGCMYNLMVVDLNFDDEAEYSLIVGDERTSAFLLVEGMYSRVESDIDDSDNFSESQGLLY